MSLKRFNRNRKQSLCAINSSRALYTSTRRPLADIETSTNYSFGIMLMTWPGACRLMVSGLRWWGNMIFRSVYKYKQPSDPGEGVYCSFLLCRLDLLAWPSYKRRGQIQEQSAIWSTWCRGSSSEVQILTWHITENEPSQWRACTKFDFSTLKNMKEEAVSCHLKNVLLYKLITTATLDVCS